MLWRQREQHAVLCDAERSSLIKLHKAVAVAERDVFAGWPWKVDATDLHDFDRTSAGLASRFVHAFNQEGHESFVVGFPILPQRPAQQLVVLGHTAAEMNDPHP